MNRNQKPIGYYIYNGAIYPSYLEPAPAKIRAPQVELWLDEPKKRGLFRRFRNKKK